jgi:hypothetical protein
MDRAAIQAGHPPQHAGSTAFQADAPRPPAEAAAPQQKNLPMQVLKTLASLRITVVLFALCLLLVLYGTLAQRESGLWTVVSLYFRSIVVWVPTNIFLLNVNHMNKLVSPEDLTPLFEIPGAVPSPT